MNSTSLTPRAADHKILSRSGWRSAARTFSRASVVIAVSAYLRTSILEQGLPSDPVVLGNPVDVDRFQPAPNRPDDGTIRLVSVGRIEADKRPLLLLEAFAQAQRVRLELIGKGPQEGEVRRRARELGVSDVVTFAGQLDAPAVAERVANAHVFVTASQVETFGVAVAESIAAGTPVVCFKTTALPELVNPSCGRVVDERGGPGAFAEAVLDVVADDSFDPAAMAASIRARFSPAAVGARLGEIYQDVLDKGA